MGLFDTLRTGASGLGVAGANLAVIGDNIANMNTTGFKKSNASFADQLPLKMGTLGGMVALG
jgi:flagellar hook protein FlgE